eukprot:TRINITY_DN3932_c0_g2_i1.p1 TRINITY_DN3932_c0_g2~~TRINITY_DN3932_c0_g2_i1.p1  ORF type:complete len:777 (-),score=136.32 TRINITY_DN3932_c0_g2_i1:160-2490(-)
MCIRDRSTWGRERQVSFARARAQEAILRKIIAYWQRWYLLKKIIRTKNLERERRQLYHLLRVWKRNILHSKRARVFFADAHERRLKLALTSWKKFVTLHEKKRLTLSELQKWRSIRMFSIFFGQLKTILSRCKWDVYEEHSASKQAARAHRGLLRKKAFGGWSRYVKIAAPRRRKYELAMKFYTEKLVIKTFGGLVESAEAAKRAMRRADSQLQRRNRRRVSLCFRAWAKDLHGLCKLKRQLSAVAEAQFVKLLYMRWRRKFAQSRQSRDMMKAAQTFFALIVQRKVFSFLKKRQQLQHAGKSFARERRHSHDVQLLTWCLVLWRKKYETRRDARRKDQRQITEVCFAKWKAFAIKRAVVRRRVHEVKQALHLRQQKYLAAVLRAWRGFQKWKKRSDFLTKIFSERRRLFVLRSTFYALYRIRSSEQRCLLYARLEQCAQVINLLEDQLAQKSSELDQVRSILEAGDRLMIASDDEKHKMSELRERELRKMIELLTQEKNALMGEREKAKDLEAKLRASIAMAAEFKGHIEDLEKELEQSRQPSRDVLNSATQNGPSVEQFEALKQENEVLRETAQRYSRQISDLKIELMRSEHTTSISNSSRIRSNSELRVSEESTTLRQPSIHHNAGRFREIITSVHVPTVGRSGTSRLFGNDASMSNSGFELSLTENEHNSSLPRDQSTKGKYRPPILAIDTATPQRDPSKFSFAMTSIRRSEDTDRQRLASNQRSPFETLLNDVNLLRATRSRVKNALEVRIHELNAHLQRDIAALERPSAE